MNYTEPIKVIMADDHPLYRNGFKSVILSQYAKEVTFITEVADGAKLVDAVAKYQPDLVFTDVQMPEMDGVEACIKIKQHFPDTGVIALSMFSDPVHIMGMIRAGANGYLSKVSDHDEIIEAIRTVNSQKNYYCSNISEKVFGLLVNSNQQRRKKLIEFGVQETSVIKMICCQLTTKEIAVKMKLAEKTIEHYRQNIQEKIGARNVVGIALYAVINGIIKLCEIS